MEMHRHELRYSVVLIDASAEHSGVAHVRGKSDCSCETTTIMDRNRKSISDSELRRFGMCPFRHSYYYNNLDIKYYDMRPSQGLLGLSTSS